MKEILNWIFSNPTVQQALAKLFDSFKVKSPIVGSVIGLLIGVLFYFNNSCAEFNICPNSKLYTEIINWVSLVFAFLINSSTYTFLKKKDNGATVQRTDQPVQTK